MKRANPQGKGLVPALQAWDATRPVHLKPQSAQSFLVDYCASSLVLAAHFDFPPVPGNSYYLYACGDVWRLSLISPVEWGARRPGIHVARCDLRGDMTWSLQAADDLADHPRVVQALERHMDAFTEALDTDLPMMDSLPFHVAELSFYPRLFASALARSLSNSLRHSGLTNASGKRLLNAGSDSIRLLHILPPAASSAT